MIFDVTYMLDVLRQIIPYTPITLFLAIASMVLAGVFGLGIALIKQFQIPVLKQIVTVYVSFFRSIPTIAQSNRISPHPYSFCLFSNFKS